MNCCLRTWICVATILLFGTTCAVGQEAAATDTTATDTTAEYDPVEQWSMFKPGDGALVARSDVGELSISLYAMVRYMNQMPADQTFTDHLGNEHDVDTRHDIFSHRIMIFLKGWVGSPKLRYTIFNWTVNTTDQDGLYAVLGYQFDRKFSLYGGINGLPGTRSLQGSHPYWLAHDRVMADEFFRSFFTMGVWATGELFEGFWYNAMVGNNNSTLGTTASQLDRKMSAGASFWWMPTTKEFGARGGYGDFEHHEEVATRFGISTVQSPEERYTDPVTGATGNTTLKLADSINVFDTGALATDVTVETTDFRLLSMDAGFKYRGIFLQAEFYSRWLNDFVADGALPNSEINDKGFYVQAAFFPIKQKLELYGVTSQIFGDKDAGFENSAEYTFGGNWYIYGTRDIRLNLQVLTVDKSPVSSTFGYYVGGQKGTTVATSFSIMY